MTDDAHSTAESPAASRGASPRAGGAGRRFVVFMLVGALAGVLATLVGLRIVNNDPTPRLTREIFDVAHERWKQVAPADYEIEIRVTGSQPAVYRAVVRGGQPQAAWRNGEPLATRRTFGTWSVPGMFSTISRDVETVERQTSGQADPRLPPLILRAAFDEQYGYPKRYRRTEWGSRKGTTAQEVKWEVTSFRLAPSE